MITSVQAFAPQTLSSGDVLAYTVPVSTTATIRACTVHNSDTSPHAMKVFVVPSTGTVAATYELLSKTLAAGQSYLCPEIVNHILKAGDRVYMNGEGNNAMLSVMEQVQ